MVALRRPAPACPDAPCPPDPAVAQVLAHREGPLRVIGGPGTGKTTLTARWVAELLARRDADPEQVLVLTASRRAAGELRERITGLLAESSVRTTREPMVRTVHSYAFGLLRLRASRHHVPPPRLLSGPEQDVMIRDLLAGDAEAGGVGWPARIRPALTMPAFAAELRDLLMRSAERGLGPEGLVALGLEQNREEWVAAGRFYERYEQVTLLRGSAGTEVPEAVAPALDAAELVSEALLVLETDHEALARERNRLRCIVVDDAQHLDPQQANLIRMVTPPAGALIVLGDPDQTVYSFRGADPELLADTSMPVARLTLDHRNSPAVRAGIGRLRDRLPRFGRSSRFGEPAGDTDAVCDCVADDGELTVRVFRSAAQEASWVADRLRRAHLQGGVPWSDMAVVVRSTARSLPVLRRALLAAGVPAIVPADALPVARQGAVVPLLTLLRAAMRPAELADEDTAATLLRSPLGGADPLTLRRLRRELRRVDQGKGGQRSSAELLAEVLGPGGEGTAALELVDEVAAAPALRLARLLDLAATAARDGQTAEEVLWAVWDGSGLAARWAGAVRRGGPTGAQADRDLDAVVGLFDAAARYADRLPGADGGAAGVLGFCDYVTDQQIVGDSLAPRSPQGESVAVLTAHASAGREWTVVAVPGVQEGAWPDLRLRGSLLGVEQLIDEVSGWSADGSQPMSRSAPVLAEERRLLLLAASRARHTLLVSAVQGADEQPSRFLDELDGSDTDAAAEPRVPAAAGRALNLPALVAELRRVVVDPSQDHARRAAAAAGLARLADARVPGAHPGSWYGLAEPSTDLPLRVEGRPVAVSPSLIELVSDCPLRWVLSRHGGQDASELPAVTGILVHGLLQAAAAGADDAELEQALRSAWTAVDAGAPWFSRAEQDRVRSMMTAFRGWLDASRGTLTQVALERDVAVRLPGPDGDEVLLRGRVDRLERDAEGRPVVVDIKSSKTQITKQAVAEHAQLATYQLAAAAGAFTDDGLPAAAGGASIVQVTKTDRAGGAKEMHQPPLDGDGLEYWLAVVQEAARRAGGARFTAVESADCERCPSRIACPLHDSGRQVTE